MRLPDMYLRTALNDALSGIVYAGDTIPISSTYNNPDESFPRIIISGISSLEQGAKGCFMFESDTTIIVQDKRRNVDSTDAVETICDQILQILIPAPEGPFLPVENFIVWSILFNNSSTNELAEESYIYTAKTIRLNIKTEQNA